MKTLWEFHQTKNPIGTENLFFDLCSAIGDYKKEVIYSVETQNKTLKIIEKISEDKIFDIIIKLQKD